jgi:hypothetical protein
VRALWALLAAALTSCATLAQAQTPPTAAPGPKRATAMRVPNGRIVGDGRLDEVEWQAAAPATSFFQQQPREGTEPTLQTEVRFLYDDDNLYVGAFLHDDEPDRLITNELTRDFNARDGDLFVLVLDTFFDRRNAYGFQTNPMGAVRDVQAFDEGRTVNDNWDGVWLPRTSVADGGWVIEFVIPFKTVRFPRASQQEWGLNMMRLIRRKNEVTTWTNVPRQFNQFRLTFEGVLEGIEGVRPGLNLRVKPFATGGVTSRQGRRTSDADGGFDVKLGLGTNLVLDTTYRTDFSQVEADTQQVNLTRFNLFFPERREFFLENQGSFQIGRAATGNNDFVPFFSRSIGLSGGLPVPIEGGTRLSGRAGNNDLGLLNIQTAEENFSVLRYGRSFLQRSSANVFYLGKERGQASNRLGGGDLRLGLGPNFDIDALYVRSDTAGVGDDDAWRTGFVYDSSRTRLAANYTSLGADFRDELGFIPRLGVDIVHAQAMRRSRPRRGARVFREIRPELLYDLYDRPGFGVESAAVRPTLTVDFQDGTQASAQFRTNEEAIATPFRIRPTYAIAPGRYTFEDGELSLASSRARRVSVTGAYRLGEFWNGTRDGVSAGVRVRVNAKTATSLTTSRDNVRLPGQTFTTDLVQARLDQSFSTRMFLTAFLQYNSVTRDVSSNIRFQFMHHPLSDLFVVYNETRPVGTQLPGAPPLSRALVVKLTHLFSY